MKAPNWKSDYLSWLSHSGYFLGVQLSFGAIGWSMGISLMLALWGGYCVGSTVFYLREAIENKNFEFWHWSKWDSVLDFIIPMVVGLLPLFLSFTFTA